MGNLKMHTKDVSIENFTKLQQMFPNAITETKDLNGNIIRGIDKDKLMQEISSYVVEGKEERYEFTWPDKRNAILSANKPINKTLRPNLNSSKNFYNTKNILIEGDNLDALKLLQETYLQKIKLIYMDPPYNAGEDILYKNNYEMTTKEYLSINDEIDENGHILLHNLDSSGKYHTNWLNMMYSRIKISRDLLKDDGCLVLAIDNHELVNLVKICDEIYGEFNRIGIVTVVHKPEGRNQERWFATSNEFALFYAKNKSIFNFEPVIFDDKIKAEYTECDDKGKYKLISYIAKNHGREGFDKNLRKNSPNRYYPLYVSPDLTTISLSKEEGWFEIYPNTKTQERTWKYVLPSFIEKLKQNEFVAKKVDGEVKIFEKYRETNGQLIKTHWVDKRYNAMTYGTKVLDELMGVKTFDFPKSIYLMEDIIKLTTNKDSIILDIFAGSGTTAHATMLANLEDNKDREFILVQLPWECGKNTEAYKNGFKNITDITKQRIDKAGNNLLKETNNASIDIGFRNFYIDSSNMKDVYYLPNNYNKNMIEMLENNIKEDRTPIDLLFQIMLELGIQLSAVIKDEEIDGKKIYFVNNNELIACFDLNITNEVVTYIAKKKPLYVVFRDNSFVNDSLAVNFSQIFETYSPESKKKVL